MTENGECQCIFTSSAIRWASPLRMGGNGRAASVATMGTSSERSLRSNDLKPFTRSSSSDRSPAHSTAILSRIEAWPVSNERAISRRDRLIDARG